MDPVPDEPASIPAEHFWQPPRKFRDRVWLHVLLFLLTVVTTMYVGSSYYASWITDLGGRPLALSPWTLLLHGAWYSATVLLILGAHEFGHYFACRYYDVDASLPFFLPLPLPPSGTLGAVIRIREPIPSKRMLFDIGIAGPIAGFVVAVVALIVGEALSNVVVYVNQGGGLEYGEPPIFQFVSWVTFGTVPEGYTINSHPMVFAAWFGFLATALNLFPIGQLDGGHIAYAVIGKQSSILTLITVGCVTALSLVSINWIVWTVLTVTMLIVFGRHHPRTFDESVPLNSSRLWLALFAVAMFVLSFTPVAIRSL